MSDDDRGYRKLGLSVLAQAFADLRNGHDALRRRTLSWLLRPQNQARQLWADLAALTIA